MNIATWSIRNPIPSIVLFLILTVAGLIGFSKLPIQDFADMELPTVNAVLILPGAAPSQLETEVARPVEDALASVSGLKHLRTSITESQVSISIEFDLSKSLGDAIDDVKDAIDRVRATLPSDLESPVVTKLSVANEPVLTFAVASRSQDKEAIGWLTDDRIARAVMSVRGVGRFDKLGGVQHEMQVRLNESRMAALGVTPSDVSSALKSVQLDASGGRGDIGGQQQSVRTLAAVQRADELRALPIALSNGRSVRLDRVATIVDTIADRSQAALLDGKPAIGFSIYRSKDFDETIVATQVRKVLADLAAADDDLSIDEISGTVDHTLEQYS